MSDSTLRRIVVVVIAMLLVHQIGIWLVELIGALGATLSALVVAGVTGICAYMARAGVGKAGWFIVPTIVLTIIPLSVRVWRFFTDDKSLWDRAIEHAPFFVGFLMPVLLLLVVFVELRKREPVAKPMAAAELNRPAGVSAAN